MNIPSLFLSFLRHTGYALVSLGALLVGIEFFVPAFSTPYIHLYRLLVLGLVLALLGGRNVQARIRGRWGMGAMVTGVLLFALFTQLSVQGSTMVLVTAACMLVIVFFVLSVYSKDL